ncbi:hypothetical protein HRbin30_02358 [bacterium HR30]|nr:hypothetical protein HRbin30_02358 [bacterium HR30]
MPWTARIQRPRTVVVLRAEHVVDNPRFLARRLSPQEAVEEDVFGVHCDVGFQGKVPIPAGVLYPKQVTLRPANGFVQAVFDFAGRIERNTMGWDYRVLHVVHPNLLGEGANLPANRSNPLE